MNLSWNLAAASILSLSDIKTMGTSTSMIVEALALPAPPLASTRRIIAHGARRHFGVIGGAGALSKQRSGNVCLNGPLNVMSMDQNVGAASDMVPDPINVTSLVDPSALDVIDWVDAAEVAAHVTGGDQARPIEDFLPKELPIVEEDVVVIQSPEDRSALFAPGEVALYPSMAKIIKFSLPAIGVWLCSPVLSMIDTASVGLLAGTAQQAALNPAVSVTDYGALLVGFMYTATTNLIAGAQEKDKLGQSLTGGGEGKLNQPRTTKTLLTALRLAVLVGVTFGAFLGTAAPFLLKMLIGNSTLDPVVFQSALRYVQIRSLGMPAAVVIGTAQSACLGMKDVKSPLYVLAAAAGINLVGDMLLVRNASPWLGGAAGAAWATVLSQYGALIMFLRWLTVKSKKENDAGNNGALSIDPMTMIKDTSKDVGKSVKVTFGNTFKKGTSIRKKLFSSPKETKVVGGKDKMSNDAPAKGFLSGSHNPISILNPRRLGKSKSTIQKFLPFVIPVTTTSIGRVSGFLTMSHVASSAFGTLDMAAHQIAISIFCCLAPVVDALNQVAQSFVPGIFARKKGRARADALRNTSLNFAKVGALFGSTLVVGVALGVPALAPCFTSDPTVIARVRSAIPGLAIFLGFDGLMCIAEGTLLGQNDLKFLRNMYASFFFIVPAFMLRLKRRALSGIEVGIGTLWATFSAYEVVRTILWLARVAWLQYKMDKEVDEIEAAGVAP